MASIDIVHEIALSRDAFWGCFLDAPFQARLLTEGLDFVEAKVLEDTKDSEGRRARRFAVVPKLDLPGPVARLLGPSFGYVEDGEYDPREEVYRFRIRPGVLGDRIRIEGRVAAEAIGAERCRCVVAGTVNADVFAVGGLLETTAVKNMESAWKRSVAYTEREASRRG